MKEILFLEEEVFHLNNGISSYFFKVKNGKDKEYSVNIKMQGDTVLSCHCTCIFYSYYGWSKKNLTKHNPPRCKHIKMAIEKIENGNK
jgi:hypothetical protein